MFNGCKASSSHGGALYINNVYKTTLTSLIFNQNKAELQGGGAYFACPTPYNCKYTFDSTNTFNGNTAGQSGGAFYWSDVEPKFTLSKLNLYNNKALLYANDVGSIAQKLVSLTSDQYTSQMTRVDPTYQKLIRFLQDSTSTDVAVDSTNKTLSSRRSGDSLPKMYIGLADKYGQIIGTTNDAKLTVQVTSKNSTYLPNVKGTTQFYSENGVFTIESVSFSGTPGENYQVKFITDAIDDDKPSNKEYQTLLAQNSSNSTNSTVDIAFDLVIKLRECEVGEVFTDQGLCESCPANTSFSLVKMDKPGSCKTCPSSKAVCSGGSDIGPQAGYWRKSNSTYNFIKCLLPEACLGMIAPDYVAQGSCLSGYKGILCTNCQDGYSTSSGYKCGLCPEYYQNVLRILAIVICAVVVVVVMVRSTLKGALEKRNVMSIFQKIILNHFQLIILTASFDFNWPELIVSFFKVSEPVGEVSTQIFSVDCFLRSSQSSDSGILKFILSIRSFFLKLFLISILPFLLFIISYTVWKLIFLRQKNKELVQSKSISSVVILLFLVHPNIVTYVFNAFNCIDIDGENRMKQDLEVLCYSGQHFFMAFTIALPSMIVWGLGIPFFAFILLFRDRKRLEDVKIREKFGFLFRGYKQRFYYWEIVIMYRKIALIFIQVFLTKFGVITQALVVYLFLIIFMMINMTKKPFQTIVLNQLETLSLVTSMISVFCGLFFIVSVESYDTESSSSSNSLILDDNTKLFFFSIIVLSNMVFFIYWLFKMYQEVRNMFIKKFSFIYVYLCLCGNFLKYEDSKKLALINEENEILREKLTEKLRKIKLLYDHGELILNQKTLEKLFMYLDDEKILNAAGVSRTREIDEMQKLFDKARNQRKQSDILLQKEMMKSMKGLGDQKLQQDFVKNYDMEYNETGIINERIDFEELGEMTLDLNKESSTTSSPLIKQNNNNYKKFNLESMGRNSEANNIIDHPIDSNLKRHKTFKTDKSQVKIDFYNQQIDQFSLDDRPYVNQVFQNEMIDVVKEKDEDKLQAMFDKVQIQNQLQEQMDMKMIKIQRRHQIKDECKSPVKKEGNIVRKRTVSFTEYQKKRSKQIKDDSNLHITIDVEEEKQEVQREEDLMNNIQGQEREVTFDSTMGREYFSNEQQTLMQSFSDREDSPQRSSIDSRDSRILIIQDFEERKAEDL